MTRLVLFLGPRTAEVFRQDSFLENLQAANDKLETVQKGLLAKTRNE